MAFDWTEFLRNQFGINLTPPAEKFIPTYETPQEVSFMTNVGVQQSVQINPYYFVTVATAEWLRNKYEGVRVITVPFGGVGGPNTSSAQIKTIVFKNGVSVIAGELAKFYTQNPNNPNVAENAIKTELNHLAGIY